ncbi:glutaredoxin family protein [Leucobacter viscericola]|uniref:Glutaredoxin family protein n=1 Tax=Leucobacter viscericola TaxID=2714935 RepID=A0A6G7XGF5_9MICO|nr:glutaredoxin family protein [Leucobacter viscericola]QIK63690.1 glutaredoxin family protein [Leucobacter viscericola]
MAAVNITLIGKPGCHLCDDAREVVEGVCSQLSERGIATELEELNILEDEQLARLYSEEIPVVRVGGKQHAIWRVDADKFERAILRVAQ